MKRKLYKNQDYSTIMANGSSKETIGKPNSIKADLDSLKEHMVDRDTIMTKDDFLALKDYRKQKKTGKLVCHGEVN